MARWLPLSFCQEIPGTVLKRNNCPTPKKQYQDKLRVKQEVLTAEAFAGKKKWTSVDDRGGIGHAGTRVHHLYAIYWNYC